MEVRGSEVSANDAAVPQIMVTEPSPVIINAAVSTSKNGTLKTVESSLQNKGETSRKTDVMQGASASEPGTSAERETSGEFTTAQSCNDCVVPVQEQSHSAETTTATASETEQDDFRTVLEPGNSCFIQCMTCYEKVWNFMYSAYALPIWIILLALPLSAGIMGALHMYSCPAGHATATLIFIIGISLMAVITLRICLIIHRMTYEDENSRQCLHTLMLVATFLTVIFFLTESVAFWRMDSTSHAGTAKYCNPRFVTFAFWWNCFMSVVIVPLFLFPA